MKISALRVSLLVTLALTLPLSAFGQSTTGSINGIVTGPDGVPLPGVTVVANSPASIQRDATAVTNADGFYRIALLPPGHYELRFELPSFRPLERSRILVQVGQATPVDTALELESVTETEVVVGEARNIDPRRAELGFNYGDELAENIPTARDMNDLFSTVPGVESVNNLGGGVQPGTIEVQNVLGTGERSSSYRYDGMNTTDPAGQWNTQALMSYDIVEEVQILKAAKPAEVPFQGALFNVITKSGGNRFSGNVGAYFADGGLQSSNTGDFGGELASNELEREYELSAAVGGKLITDELWWFVSGRLFDSTRDVFAFPVPVSEEIQSFSGKLTWQANQNHRFVANATAWDQEVSHYFFGYSPALSQDERAASARPLDGQSVGAQWSGVFGRNVIAEANVNYSEDDFDQDLQPGGRRAVVDLVTGQRRFSPGTSAGALRDQDNEFWNARANVSWFVPEAAGQHDIKFGVEYMPTRTRIGFGEPEGHQLHTLFGNKFAVRLLNTPTIAIWDNDLLAFYVQDAWSVGDRLTLNIGLRYMHTDATSPEQVSGGGPWANTALVERFPEMALTRHAPRDLVTWDTIEPRLAATYQLGASGSTILRFGASRYYQNLDSFKFFVASPSFPNTWVTLWNDANDDFEYQVGEEGPLLFSFGGALNSVDPSLRRPYTDELVIGVSHEFAREIQVSANGILRRDRDLSAAADIGDTRYAPVDVLDPGPDGIPGTGDDSTLTVFEQDAATIGNNRLQITNPGGERDFKGIELTVSKRLRDNWQGVASLVWSEMRGNQSTVALGTLGVFDSPNGLINAEGLDEVWQTVQLKLQGTYLFDFGLHVSGLYRFRTGNPYTRELVVTGLNQGPFNVRAEPRGDSETDNVSTVDLRLEQTFDLAAGRFGVMADAFNLFNASPSVDEGIITGSDYGEVLSVQTPRLLRLGVRYVW